MSGYTRVVIFRRTPANGPQEKVAVATAFAGQRSPLFSTRVRYIPLVEEREDVERRQQPLKEGYRVRLEMTFIITTIADHAILAKVKRWLSATDGKTEVALDTETTYREAYLFDLKGPEPLGGKTIAGMKWVLDVDIVDPISEIKTMTASVAGSPW